MANAMMAEAGERVVTGAGKIAVVARARAMEALQAKLDNLSVKEQIERLFEDEVIGREDEEERRRWALADVALLREAALAYASEPGARLQSVIDRLRYRIATRAPLVELSVEPRVQIMTLHSAKGLQGRNVVLLGASDQLIPGTEKDQQKRGEQRRLLYVAATRAKDHLVVSHARYMTYVDAVSNYVRRDSVVTRGSEKVFVLSRSTLLPQSLGSFQKGEEWKLRRIGVGR